MMFPEHVPQASEAGLLHGKHLCDLTCLAGAEVCDSVKLRNFMPKKITARFCIRLALGAVR